MISAGKRYRNGVFEEKGVPPERRWLARSPPRSKQHGKEAPFWKNRRVNEVLVNKQAGTVFHGTSSIAELQLTSTNYYFLYLFIYYMFLFKIFNVSNILFV